MWYMQWRPRDCFWVIVSPLDIIVARTYNKQLAMMLLEKFKTECPWKEPNNGKEKTKEEKEDFCSDD